MKNKSDIISLHLESQKLYEKLSVLRFVEESFGDQKPTIGAADVTGKIDDYFDKGQEEAAVESPEHEPAKEARSSEEPTSEKPEITQQQQNPENQESAPDDENQDEMPEVPEAEAENTDDEAEVAEENNAIPEDVPPTVAQPETIVELEVADADREALEQQEKELSSASENQKADESATEEKPSFGNDNLFAPAFELAFDPKTDDAVEKSKDDSQFSFDDLLGKDYADPVFIKPDEVKSEKKFSDYTYKDAETIKAESKAVSLNDRLSKGITIGLNDRIAFIKHLFGDSSEDYNRVLSQLMTFDSYDEARNFINEMVKPDYNDWQGKDEYAQRFMEIVEKRFS